MPASETRSTLRGWPGLWNIAGEQPDLTALVDPDGREMTYGELAAAADRYGRGFGSLGLEPGDSIVLMLPNSAELVAVYFAAYADRSLRRDGQLAPDRRRGRVPRAGQRRQGFRGARTVRRRGGRGGGRPAGAATPSATSPASARSTQLGEGETGRPDVRTAGSPMLYTSGTTGRPKGVRRPLTGNDPDIVPPSRAVVLRHLRDQGRSTGTCTCAARRSTTPRCSTSWSISIQLGHTAVLMDHWDPEDMLRLIEKHRVTHSHMVPTQFHRLLALPDDVRAKLRPVLAARR